MSDKSLEILEELVAFPSVSGLPTHEIIKYIKNQWMLSILYKINQIAIK